MNPPRMNAARTKPFAETKVGAEELHPVPLTLDGAAILHQMVSFDWTAWGKLDTAKQSKALAEFVGVFALWEGDSSSALYSLLGHKGDLLLAHFRNSFDELNAAELKIKQLGIFEFLNISSSYLSVVELGLYESSVKLYRELVAKQSAPHSAEWNQAVQDLLARQAEAMKPRLFPKIPASRYLCFYPMDRLRGEDKNWYQLPIAERQRQMEEHGQVGRRYAGKVQQIISGSIGFDDWEWGVDLFADDPLIFKKLIYEMRFDEVSAIYAKFGTFYVGIRCPAGKLGNLLAGETPE
jgi:peroxiredoxin